MAKPAKPLMFAKTGDIYEVTDETITNAALKALIDTIYPETAPAGVKKFGNISPDSPWELTFEAADDIDVVTWDRIPYIDPGLIKWGSNVTRVDMTPDAMRTSLGAVYHHASKMWGIPDPKPRIKRLLVVSEDAYGTRYGQVIPTAVISASGAPVSTTEAFVGFPMSMKFLRDENRFYFYLGGELLDPNDGHGVAVLTAKVVTAVTIIDAGEEHLVAPAVVFEGGDGGTGAEATAVLGADGSVESVNVTAGGTGYNSIPTAKFVRAE
jgi:hypothetical protein